MDRAQTVRNASRRDFLKKTGAAAFAAPYVLTSNALAAPGRVGANDRVHIGHIGINWMGGDHLKMTSKDKNNPVVALCDVDAKILADRRKLVTGDCEVYSDYRKLLENKSVDAVIVAVPDHWHGLIAVAACEAGKDVYCEKPLSLDVRQGRAMVNAARRNNRIFQVGSQQRTEDKFRRGCELVRSGRIGKVHTVEVNVWGTSKPCDLPAEETPEHLNWDMWLGPAPKRAFNGKIHPVNWRAFREYAGGTMTDWGAHHLDIAQWGLGTDDTGPIEIHPPSKLHKGLRYVYASGVELFCGHVQGRGARFIGSEGWVEVDRGHLATSSPEIEKTPLGSGDVRLRRPAKNVGNPWRRNELDFIASVKSRQRPLCDVEIGFRTVTMCHLGNIALWTGKSIKWDPVKEEIIDNPEASKWLAREVREPYRLDSALASAGA